MEDIYRKKIQLADRNSTWKLVNLSSGANVINEKWCFKLKKDGFRHIWKFNPRWKTHGYNQEEKLDHVKKFAKVVKPWSYKCILAVGVKRGYQNPHMVVVTAFLYSFFDKVIYVNQPNIFATELNKVCKLIKLIKALYRLKQHICYKILVEFFIQLRFIRLELDYQIFMSEE